jgi:hypothetical protein
MMRRMGDRSMEKNVSVVSPSAQTPPPLACATPPHISGCVNDAGKESMVPILPIIWGQTLANMRGTQPNALT